MQNLGTISTTVPDRPRLLQQLFLYFHIALDKAFFFHPKKILTFFYFFHEKICCGYSEAPNRGASNEYQ